MNKIDSLKLAFFLGGHDAEMDTIREILFSKEILCYDKNLAWGAKLSDYQNELKNIQSDHTPVLVELTIDIEKPDNALIVDHHGENAGKDKKTSLEQVAEKLDIKLNRWQKLISANDRGYIPAMKEMGATNKEIEKIRAYDRKCQGATEKDERLAEQSIREHSEILGMDGSTILIKSLTEKTSCVNDRLWIEHKGKFTDIFIISPTKVLSYFGSEKIINRLKRYYEHQQRSDTSIKFWFGGELPNYGYFGANSSIPSEIIKAMIKEPIISQHIFMFPFKIEKKAIAQRSGSNSDDVNGDGQETNLQIKYSELLKSDRWKEEPYKVTDSKLNYNEFVYFYDYIREAIFPNYKDDHKSQTSIYFEKDVNDNSEMVIHIKTEREPLTYYLEVNHVALRLFDTEVGILTIELVLSYS